MKWDGHTHSEFCPHGSGEDTELFIRRALELGMSDYSITEHAPLPADFLNRCAGERRAIDTAGIALGDVEVYLQKMLELKRKYQSDLRLHIGFEMDYLPDYEGWTADFLNEYGEYIEDSILSLHFLPGSGGYRAIDYQAEDYNQGIVAYYGSFQQAQTVYYQVLKQSVDADLGPYKPKRIGHISLCRKFKKFFPPDKTDFSSESEKVIVQILNEMKNCGYSLDYNTAGLFKPFCGEPYPPDALAFQAIQWGIPFVFGSDAHWVKDVGAGYSRFVKVTAAHFRA